MKYGNLEEYKSHSDEEGTNIFIRLFSSYLDKHHAQFKTSNERITFSIYHLARYTESELYIIDNLLDEFTDTYELIVGCVEIWCEHKREVAFEVPNKIIPQLLNNQINHHWENKLIKVVGMVDVVGSWASYPKYKRYECNKCGEIYNIIVDRPRKFIQCKCKNRITTVTKTYYISRKTITLNQKDVANSVPAPCFYEVPTEVQEDALFSDSQVLGNQVEMLCVPRPILTPSQYCMEDVEWHLQVYGLKKRKFRIISKDRAQEIIKTIKADKEAYRKVAFSMTSKTYGQEYLRLFVLASAIGLLGIDKDIKGKNPAFNGLVVGDPSLAKSFTTKQLIEYFPLTQYAQGSSTSTVGLLGGIDKGKGGNFVMRAGAVQQCDGGLLILDELDKMPQEQTRGLFTALSDGHHTITKVTGQHEFTYNTCFVCIANPKHSKFDYGSNLYGQIDLDSAYMSRMVWINIVKRPYLDESGQIDQEKHRIHRAYVTGRMCYDQDYDDDFLKDYAILVKQTPNAVHTTETKIMCENYFAQKNAMFEAKKKADFQNSDIDLTNKSIDERMLTGLMILCKIIGRANFSKEVKEEHFELAKDMLENGMLKDMIGVGAGTLDEMEVELEKIQTKTTVKSRKDKIYHIIDLLPEKETEVEEFIQTIHDKYNWSKSEIEQMLNALKREGEWYEPRNGTIKKVL